MSVTALTALCFNMMALEANAPGIWLPMIPAGNFTGIDGRSWRNPNPDAVVASFTKKRPFDVEHATHIKAPKGEEAPASGWITQVENRAGEIWGFVKWNAEGRELIEEEKYAFYSPAFAHDPDTGVIYSLESAGLTNSPNLNVPALNRQEDDPMKLPKLLTDLLGLAEDASAEQAVVAINAIKQAETIALNRSNTPDLNKFIPIETHQVALNRATTAEAALKTIADKEIDALVQTAIDAGKVAPANKDMFVGMCRTEGGIEQFKNFVGSAPAIATNAQKKLPVDTNGVAALEEHEIAMCRKMGVSKEEFLAAKQQMNVGAN
ncbi:peptidase [Shewanella sp. M16]|uniref:phage protease n=1 Tax=Shewanella sp. M16 TaxID=2830837 RepID=UPI001BAEE9B2|nr:phage protease [Shewanella sp. M16]MBS0044513.1 peptidase [Shewanella sp. M16]QYW06272.1 protease I [Shewanella phage vB_SspM_MuM16-2]